MLDKINQMYESKETRWWQLMAWTLLVAALVIWSASTITEVGIAKKGLTFALSIIQGIVNPDRDLLFNLTKQSVPYLLLETMAIAFLGTLVGAVFSFPLSFLASSKVVPVPVVVVTRFLVMAIRTIPAFVYGLMFIRVTGPGPFAGVMTISVTSIGMLTKLFSEAIDDMDKSILEALDAAGCNTFEKIRCGIIPQLWSSLLSTMIFRFDMNLRDASILGLVGGGGIGAPLKFAMSSNRWSQVGAILVGLVVLILVVEFSSSAIRKRLTNG